jgi:hypothetical protein
MSMDEWTSPPLTGYGRRLDTEFPSGVLAYFDTEHAATPQKIAQAENLFTRASIEDFEQVGETGRKWLHKETQIQYVIEQSQVLMADDPRGLGIDYFVVLGPSIHFLRRRDFDPATYGYSAPYIPGGQIVTGPDGRSTVVPTRPRKYDDRPWLVAS